MPDTKATLLAFLRTLTEDVERDANAEGIRINADSMNLVLKKYLWERS